jgi:hypothetical protein
MTELRQKMIKAMKLRDLSENTQRGYLQAVTSLAKYYRLPPDQLSQEMIDDYLLYLKNDLDRAPKTCGVAKAALTFFYNDVLADREISLKFSIKRHNRKLPVVLSPGEVWKIINAATNIKNRLLLMTTYSSGLRAIVVDILAALVFGVDLFDQVACAVVIVKGLLAHGPGLSDQAVVAVVGKLGSLVLGIGQRDQVVAVIVAVAGNAPGRVGDRCQPVEAVVGVGGRLAFGIDPGAQVAGRVVAEGGDKLVADAQQIALGKLAAPAVVLELAREGGKVDAGRLVAATGDTCNTKPSTDMSQETTCPLFSHFLYPPSTLKDLA